MTEIIIDENIWFGKPITKGTRIPVDEILGALAGGMDYGGIEKEFGVHKDGVMAALKYAAEIVSGEQVGIAKVKR